MFKSRSYAESVQFHPSTICMYATLSNHQIMYRILLAYGNDDLMYGNDSLYAYNSTYKSDTNAHCILIKILPTYMMIFNFNN